MDPLWLIILIVMAAIFVIGVFMVIECMESCFHKDRCNNNDPESPSSPYVVTNHFTKLTDEPVIETCEKERQANPLSGAFGHLHRGGQTIHARGLCNHGGGAWGTSMSVSGRAATTSLWAPVSGGPFDSCQCEDNGGFH